MRRLRIAACVTALATAGLGVASLLVAAGVIPVELSAENRVSAALFAVAVIAPTAIGLLIALRQPRNRIAWILLIGSLVQALYPAVHVIGNGWALQFSRAGWPLLFAWPIAIAYVFPNGTLLSRRWRWVVIGSIANAAVFITLGMFDASPFDPPDEAVRNPLLHNAIGEAVTRSGIWVPFWIGILSSVVAGAIAIRLRVRRSTGIERLQALWLAWAALLLPLSLALAGVSAFVLGDLIEHIGFPLIVLAQATVAGAVGVAVVRYRLYAIERLINRTLVYVTLTVLLMVVYAGVTLGLGVLVGGGTGWVVAIATLTVGIAILPLRARLQDAVDRRFARARYDGVRRMRDFEEEVREGRRAPEQIGAVLRLALGDPLADVFFWLPETEAYTDATGELTPQPVPDGRTETPITRAGARIATVVHDPGLLDRRDLLSGVLRAARLSIEIARLRVELRLQLSEVDASRMRIVEAGYEERRRLERDLHDGAQQRLVSMGLRIRRLQRTLPPEAGILSPALDAIVAEVGATIGDLRQIAAGVRPARLDDGLSAALRDLARSAPVATDVDVPDERVAASVEAAAYFVACEALTNAVKYAGASRVAMRAVHADGTLLLTVTDDGVGGAVLRRGSGLAGLKDRVAAYGGTLEVDSPPGEGTRIHAVIPCAS